MRFRLFVAWNIHSYIFSYICLLFIFVVLMLVMSALFPVPVISLSPRFMSSLGCKDLCIVMNFLVLFSISSSLLHFRNGLCFISRKKARVFILLIRFILCNLVSSSFLILPRYFFFHLSMFDGTIYQPLRSGRIWHKVNF